MASNRQAWASATVQPHGHQNAGQPAAQRALRPASTLFASAVCYRSSPRNPSGRSIPIHKVAVRRDLLATTSDMVARMDCATWLARTTTTATVQFQQRPCKLDPVECGENGER